MQTYRKFLRPAKDSPLAIDLYCGLGGWAEGLLAEGFRVIGFDVERHDYGAGGYPGHLVIQDVTTLHGSQFRDAAVIVASPPCQAYSYRAMPWKRAKALPPPDNTLFEACFRIQKEACEAAGRYIPLIVENVRGAQPWVGRAKANFGSYYLWGDVGMVGRRVVAGVPRYGVSVAPMGRELKRPGRNFHFLEKYGIPSPSFHGHDNEPSVVAAAEHVKVSGISFSGYGSPDYKPQGFNVTAAQRYREGAAKSMTPGIKQHGSGREWFAGEGTMGRMSSKSNSRKAASAMIAKIPFPLAQHIAKTFKQETF